MPPNVVFLLIIILVPIAPSYFLFKKLPSTAIVSGPFKGLRIDLSGGFGGYFLVFLILVGIRSSFESTAYEKWVVTGQILFPDASSIYVDPRYVTLSVPSLRSDADGNFSMNFLTTSDGEFDYPHMYISFPGYVSQAFWLGPKDKNVRHESLPASFDATNHKIDLGTIHLVKLPVVATTAAPNSSQSNPYSAH